MQNIKSPFVFSLFLVFAVFGSNAVKITEFEVPGLAKTHEDVTLICKFDLENGEVLRAVRWFYDNETFFEFLPNENPIKNLYPIPGMNVDLNLSNATHIHIRNVRPVNRGDYRCAVISGHPIDRDMKTGHMLVYSINITPQTLEFQDRFEVTGDNLKLICSNPISRPMARLSFEFNGNKISEQYVVQKMSHLRESGPHYTSQAELNIPRSQLRPLGPSGSVAISCISTYLITKNMSRSEVVIRTSGRDSYRRNNTQGPDFPPANITGDVKNYNIGDEIKLNCTFDRPMPEPSDLMWTINGVFSAAYQEIDYSNTTDGLKKKGISFKLTNDILPLIHGENAECFVGCWAILYKKLYEREVVERFDITSTSMHKIEN